MMKNTGEHSSYNLRFWRPLYEINKEEVVVREVKTEVGKITLDLESKTMTIISSCFDLGQVQNFMFDFISESNEFISMPFAGIKIVPGPWTIIIKSE
ncbi:MAG: hypothetical protein ACXAAH_11490 [Promethearchaeota archaeon]|jgi:hypothetical protein